MDKAEPYPTRRRRRVLRRPAQICFLCAYLCVSASLRGIRGRHHLEFLRHAHDFFYGGDSVLDFAPAVFAEIAHAVLAGGAGEDAGIGIFHDEPADLVVDIHHFKDAHAGGIAAAVALGAAGAAPGEDVFAFGREHGAVGELAARADDADEALRQDGDERTGDQVVFHAHVGEAGDGAGGIVGMQGGEDEVAGEGGADGDIGGFAVADFAHHDDVGILADDVAQAAGEGEADLRIDVDLVDAVHLVFDGIFDGDDFLVGQVDSLEGGIEGGGLAAAGGAGDEEDAVGEAGEVLHALQHVVVEAEAAEVVEIAGGAIEESHDDAFAIEGGQGGNAEVDFAADDFY